MSTDTFGWRVLQTLADHVEALRQDSVVGADHVGPTVGIRLDKSAGDATPVTGPTPSTATSSRCWTEYAVARTRRPPP